MNPALQKFEAELQSHTNKQHGSAIRAAAKKHPAGYTAYVKKLIAGTSLSAEGFDRALAELKAAGFSRAEAMSQVCQNHPARGLWVQKVTEERRTQSGIRRGEKAPAAAPTKPAATTLRQPAQTQAMAPVAIAAAPQIVPSPVATAAVQAGAQQALGAADLAYMKKRWEHPAFRAVWGDNFDLLVKYKEGRISLEEAKSLREKTISSSSRELLKLGNVPATRPRGESSLL